MCLVTVIVLAAVIFDDEVLPHHGAPSEGTAIVVAGQRTNILPVPDFLASCLPSRLDDSSACVSTTLSAINNARAQEGIPSMVLPSNWGTLTPAEQLFVATNLERTARGLAPIPGMADALDAVAAQAATSGSDPQLPVGTIYSTVGANWIQGYDNSLEVLYEWLYDDGPGSSNVECSKQDLSGCWGHRANVLLALACSSCASGAAFAPTDLRGEPLSFAEVLVESSTTLPFVFTWEEEQPFLN